MATRCTSAIAWVCHLAQVVSFVYTCYFCDYIQYALCDLMRADQRCTLLPTSFKAAWFWSLRLLFLLGLPVTLSTIIGYLLHNGFSYLASEPCDVGNMPKTYRSLPPVRLLVVTKGDYADLVQENVSYHSKLLTSMGWLRHEIIVATERALGIASGVESGEGNVKELLIPPEYRGTRNTLYKARNLAYAQKMLPPLADDGWVVHLDEETRLGPCGFRGLADFVTSEDGPPIGQGKIVYGWNRAAGINWLTTLVDSPRVAMDCSSQYTLTQLLKIPPAWFKGGFFVLRADVAAMLSFDNGPMLSVCEDTALGRQAADLKLACGLVNGFVEEQSAAELLSLIRQRARWVRGIAYILGHYEFKSRFSKFNLTMYYGFWIGSAVLGAVAPMAVYCASLDRWIAPFDHFLAVGVACHVHGMAYGSLVNFRCQASTILLTFLLCPVLIPVFFCVTCVSCCADLLSIMYGVYSLLIELITRRLPDFGVTVKRENIFQAVL